ncbi:hypothetical protein HY771_02695 [Candidatus Uhrbacteria bacterium]|nr:hypothetical protein [Candidatus Uhrbacteria bacterium]
MPESSQEGQFFDIERPDTSIEIKKTVADAGIKLMREVLRGIDGYVVFASTGLYLQGTARGLEDLQIPPGDFDVVVETDKDLKLIQERLRNVPGVRFENNGKWKPMSGGAQVLSGDVLMTLKTTAGEKKIRYPFEFYLDTFIADQNIIQHKDQLAGLNVLSLEGLQQQYLNNLQFESRVGKRVEEVARFLLEPEIERMILGSFQSGEKNQDVEEIMESLSLNRDEIENFYKIRDEMFPSLSLSGEELEEKLSKVAVVLSGYKTKLPKRLKNVQQIQEHRKLGEISS